MVSTGSSKVLLPGVIYLQLINYNRICSKSIKTHLDRNLNVNIYKNKI